MHSIFLNYFKCFLQLFFPCGIFIFLLIFLFRPRNFHKKNHETYMLSVNLIACVTLWKTLLLKNARKKKANSAYLCATGMGK